ncbi:serine hydrolase [Flavobacterium sp. J27]|uniref:serine hydrolase domain-containing protein n=1 Tax=Flavobacterium sp. J27 TaxID=2060419 RepID=UPI001030C193|nr:serine hydrolase domain-containing protein [Flavobacterium sp. J27]
MKISNAVFLIFCMLSFSSLLSQNDTFTGYAIAQVNQDSIINIKTFGYANVDEKKQYSEKTIQPIGSVSKTFIGLALLIAQEKGILDLDTNINTYLDFKIQNPHLKGNNSITLRHLATHTSGIVDNEAIYDSIYSFTTMPKHTLQDFYYTYFYKNKKTTATLFSHYKAGKNYSYSNIGAALAAYILEKASGIPFNEFTKEHIFTPLQMKNTGWFHHEISLDQFATLYDEQDKPLALYSYDTYPDGGLKTTITDLSLYLIELIKGYHGKSNLLSEKGWKTYFSKNFTPTQLQPKNITAKEPNIGIFIVYFKSGKVGHTGSDLGASCIMQFDPKDNTGRLFMANEDITSHNLDTFKKLWKTN